MVTSVALKTTGGSLRSREKVSEKTWVYLARQSDGKYAAHGGKTRIIDILLSAILGSILIGFGATIIALLNNISVQDVALWYIIIILFIMPIALGGMISGGPGRFEQLDFLDEEGIFSLFLNKFGRKISRLEILYGKASTIFTCGLMGCKMFEWRIEYGLLFSALGFYTQDPQTFAKIVGDSRTKKDFMWQMGVR